MKTEPKQKKLHRIANVHNFGEMGQGREILLVTRKKSRRQNTQITAIASISDTCGIIGVFWSYVQEDGAAAFEFSERSTMPPDWSANDPCGGQTYVFNVWWIKRINSNPTENVQNCALYSILDTENWLDWNVDMHNPNSSEDDWEVNNESDIELDKGIKDSKTAEEQNLSAVQNVSRLI